MEIEFVLERGIEVKRGKLMISVGQLISRGGFCGFFSSVFNKLGHTCYFTLPRNALKAHGPTFINDRKRPGGSNETSHVIRRSVTYKPQW